MTRITIGTVLFLVLVGSMDGPVKADPYRWCAEYGAGGDGGSANCYFLTLDQCRAAISGFGGFCRENGFTPAPTSRRRADIPAAELRYSKNHVLRPADRPAPRRLARRVLAAQSAREWLDQGGPNRILSSHVHGGTGSDQPCFRREMQR